jgi:enoyl-CoA hydratase/carnithine racemase
MEEGGVAVITFDIAGAKVNTLNISMMTEMTEMLDKMVSEDQLEKWWAAMVDSRR